MRKQGDLLDDITCAAPQQHPVRIRRRDAIHYNRPGVRYEHAVDEFEDAALAGTAPADENDGFSLLDDEADVPEDRLPAACERDLRELDHGWTVTHRHIVCDIGRGGVLMADPNTPNQNANKEKAEGSRWSAEQSSATRAADRNDIAGNYADENGDNAGGITNRPLDQEVGNQQSLPKRGMNRNESRNSDPDTESEMDREEGRSER